MKTIINALLILHIAVGTIALFIGLVPMFSKKGSALHNRTGLVYVWCMIIIAITALLLCGLQPFKMMRVFLTGIAVFSFYLCLTGWRATKQKITGPTPADKLLTYLTLVVGMAMMGFGAYLLTNGFSAFAILFPLFGFATFRNALYDFRSFGKKPEKLHWFYHHIIRMGGSYIATFTAFLVNNVYRALPDNAPSWLGMLPWIAPGLIGGLIIGRTVRYYKQKHSGSKALSVA